MRHLSFSPALILALALLAPARPARADASIGAAGANGARLLVTLERTACYGTCPIYRLAVYSDGRVTWHGEQFVKVTGDATAHLDAHALASLERAFTDAHYFTLRGPFDCYEMTDNPSANTSFDDGKHHRAIHHYYGCTSPKDVAALTTLESRIDTIVNSVRWVGTEKERRHLHR